MPYQLSRAPGATLRQSRLADLAARVRSVWAVEATGGARPFAQ